MLERTHERFRTTSWTRVRALKSPSADQRRQVLEGLVEVYWPAVYAFLRRQGHGREESAEVTQAFFSDVVLGRALFDRASEDSGRLRTLIIRALRNYRIDRSRRAKAAGAAITLVLDTEIEENKLHTLSRLDGEAAFDKRWALALFQEALRRCEAHFRGTERAAHWELFEQRVLIPAVTGNHSRPYAQLPAASSFDSPAQAAASVQVVKHRCIALLHEVIAETVEHPTDVHQELVHVRRLLGEC